MKGKIRTVFGFVLAWLLVGIPAFLLFSGIGLLFVSPKTLGVICDFLFRLWMFLLLGLSITIGVMTSRGKKAQSRREVE